MRRFSYHWITKHGRNNRRCNISTWSTKEFQHRWEVRGAAKKSSFFSGPATKAFSPPPLGLMAIGTFFLTKKVIFSSVAHPFSPSPPLSGPATKKRTFFSASLSRITRFLSTFSLIYCFSMLHARYTIYKGRQKNNLTLKSNCLKRNNFHY